MKILLFIDSLGAGGAQRQLVGLAVMLKHRGYDVIVATYHDNRFYVDTILNAGVPYVYLKKANSPYKRIWAVAEYIRRIKPNLVIAYQETPSIVASIVHIFNKQFRLIVSERNTSQTVGVNESIRFCLFKTADYVVPNAYAQEKFIIDNFPALKKKIVTIANFVDTDFFYIVNHERRDIPEIVVAASIWNPKNTLGFLDAVKILKERELKFHISWYGRTDSNIDYFYECTQKVKRLGINDNISLLDKTMAIREKYQNADYFILPSFYEGTPNVICEAMACGLPVACSNVGDNPIYVKPEINGALFDPKSAESMADAIEKLLTIGDEMYKSYRENSRQIAETKFSMSKFIESYINLIEE